ncbi:clostripain-related cysteine peptidase [Ohtaekwangia koreensis]|uniref:Uncharacterized protein n=1 Tax=Ohtaekwangia koreensis TaxID=688867 RepID=A0A1T5ITG1_9BACT|nr:clostripain-related cysteine peptidase [Ohtaekwangia koreensis]SKC42233.1 hypothetical protein SAMN05660236_0362 [Ohtaekwangia koreensis]
MKSQKKRKWTVFFVIKATDLSVVELIEMLNELRSIKMNDEVCILLCMSVGKENREAIESGDPSLIQNPNKNLTPTTLFYGFEKSAENSEFLNDLKFIQSDDTFDITLQRDLEKFLVNTNSHRYIIFTWDHGSSYGIFNNLPNGNPQTDLHPLSDNLFKKYPQLAIKSTSLPPKKITAETNLNNEEEQKILTMDELAAALNQNFKNTKIELVVMMNCYMQLFDTGYALRRNVKYLIAPETYMFFNGYNYQFFFKKLFSNPDIPTKQLAKHIVNSFETKIYTDAEIGSIAKSVTAIFATNLSYYSLIARLIDRLVHALSRELSHNKNELIMARLNSPELNDSLNIVDFFNLLKNLQLTIGRYWQFLTRTRLWLLMKRVIVARYIGKVYYHDVAKRKFPYGFSIFFPIQLNGVIVSRRHLKFFENTSFAKERLWFNFVMEFMKPNTPGSK